MSKILTPTRKELESLKNDRAIRTFEEMIAAINYLTDVSSLHSEEIQSLNDQIASLESRIYALENP